MGDITIAVDGPGSSGKGTVARGIARQLGYQYVDTGAMYRVVALRAEREGIAWDDEPRVASLARGLKFAFPWDGDVLKVIADGEDLSGVIRTREIGRGASDVSALPDVRTALLGLQRDLCRAGAVVMDGRDIGTVVAPDAELKIYLDADLKERARRRHEELLRGGQMFTYEETLGHLRDRDAQDMGRAVAPLKQAEDAVFIDSTNLTAQQVTDRVLALVAARRSR